MTAFSDFRRARFSVVIPAQAGIQGHSDTAQGGLDSRLRGNDSGGAP